MENEQNNSNPVNFEQSNYQVSSEIYENSGNKYFRYVKYYLGKIWPYIKSIGTEVIYYIFKAGKAAIKFALIQIGLKH